jgi:hypothetical protein
MVFEESEKEGQYLLKPSVRSGGQKTMACLQKQPSGFVMFYRFSEGKTIERNIDDPFRTFDECLNHPVAPTIDRL